MIAFVSGLGRCGSSLVMRMLHAGGMELTGLAEHPFFEDGRVVKFQIGDYDWLDDCEGKVVKLLNPYKMPPPYGREYRWIWLDRDKKEQRKSQRKCSRWMGKKCTPQPIESMRKKSRRVIKRVGGKVLAMTFEDILMNPVFAAVQMADFLGLDLNRPMMASVVRQRSAKCLPHMAEGGKFMEPQINH
jgi:hypothetical protein